MKKDVFVYLKFIALLGILFFHSSADFLTADDQNVQAFYDTLSSPWLGKFMQEFYSYTFFLPLFIPITVGISLSKHLDFMARAELKPFLKKLYRMIKIAFFFLIFGVIINALSWGYEEALVWDIFHLYFFAIIFSSIVVFLFGKKILYILFFVFFLGLYFVPEELYFQLTYGEKALFGDPNGDSFWAIFPWYSLIIYGYFLKDFLNEERVKLFKTPALIISLIILYVSYLNGDLWSYVGMHNVWGKEVFMPSFGQLLSHFAKFHLLLLLFIEISYRKRLKSESFIGIYGSYTLILFLVHMIIGKHINFLIKYILMDLLKIDGYLYFTLSMILVLVHFYLIYLMGLYIHRRRNRILLYLLKRNMKKSKAKKNEG